MRQTTTPDDERRFLVRSLSIDYGASCREHPHAHAWPQIIYARSGAVRVEIDRSIWMIPPRRALWAPAGVTHALTMAGPVRLRTLYLRPDLAPSETRIRGFDVCGLLHEAILRACDFQFLDEREPAHRRLCGVLLDEIATAPTASFQTPMPDDPRARRLAEQLLEVGADQPDLRAMCAKAGLSRRTAERLFEAETGLSPARWRRVARLSLALQDLAEGASIEDTAERAGYRSRAAFSEAFSRTFGQAPAKTRR
ncbi:MAG: helix-turn-helix transcriptional regulator [Pseudomonadota bacterium]